MPEIVGATGRERIAHLGGDSRALKNGTGHHAGTVDIVVKSGFGSQIPRSFQVFCQTVKLEIISNSLWGPQIRWCGVWGWGDGPQSIQRKCVRGWLSATISICPISLFQSINKSTTLKNYIRNSWRGPSSRIDLGLNVAQRGVLRPCAESVVNPSRDLAPLSFHRGIDKTLRGGFQAWIVHVFSEISHRNSQGIEISDGFTQAGLWAQNDRHFAGCNFHWTHHLRFSYTTKSPLLINHLE